jgi:hypothetical protein
MVTERSSVDVVVVVVGEADQSEFGGCRAVPMKQV